MLGPILFTLCAASIFVSFGAWLRGIKTGRRTLLDITFSVGGMLLSGRLGAFGVISSAVSDALFYTGGALMLGAAKMILRGRRSTSQRIG